MHFTSFSPFKTYCERAGKRFRNPHRISATCRRFKQTRFCLPSSFSLPCVRSVSINRIEEKAASAREATEMNRNLLDLTLCGASTTTTTTAYYIEGKYLPACSLGGGSVGCKIIREYCVFIWRT